MKFTTTTAFLASAMAYFVASNEVSAAPLSSLDVWDPTITSPVTGTVWVIGTEVNVTWCVQDSKPPFTLSASRMMLLLIHQEHRQYPP